MVTKTAKVNELFELSKSGGDFKPAPISDNAMVVLKKRYLLKDRAGEIVETPDQMFRRVANALAEIETLYGSSADEIKEAAERFYRLMASLEFLPNSPTLMNAGTGAGTLSACFVLPLRDSMKGIMKTASDAAMVQKFGGGTGFSLSEIRRRAAPIATTHGKACGPIEVLKHLSSVSSLVTQGGKRDGANMAVMNVHHPDILEFIDCKANEGSIHNFNISVGATDAFMQAVEKGGDYPLLSPQNPADPDSKVTEVKRLDARAVFKKIVDGAWRNGEPGMIFLDTVNRNSPVLHIGEITATNPCGEQPLLPNESCNLGSIDVGKFVTDADGERAIDWKRLENAVRVSIRLLDNVIDANEYALDEIEHSTKLTRKLGLGVMGFADMLIKLDIAYDSDEGVETGRNLMNFFNEVSLDESRKLAERRGPFKGWKGSQYQKDGVKVRNACRLTVAPTGTISMLAGASSGIEPLFSLAYRKQNILGGETLYYVNEQFERVARERDFYSDELMGCLADGGSLQQRDDVPDDVKRLFRTSPDIAPRWHVLMQAAFQESTDAGISKTINFPNEATIDDVEEAYKLAWNTNCKGITVYRAGSRFKEVLTSGHAQKSDEAETTDSPDQSDANYIQPAERPRELKGSTMRIRTGRGNVYITINCDEKEKPLELFTAHGKAGGNDAAMAEAVSRLISLALRSGIDPDRVVTQIKGITDEPLYDNGRLVRSVPDAIAHALDAALKSSDGLNGAEGKPSAQKAPCPECAARLAFEEGCLKCHACGYSKC